MSELEEWCDDEIRKVFKAHCHHVCVTARFRKKYFRDCFQGYTTWPCSSVCALDPKSSALLA